MLFKLGKCSGKKELCKDFFFALSFPWLQQLNSTRLAGIANESRQQRRLANWVFTTDAAQITHSTVKSLVHFSNKMFWISHWLCGEKSLLVRKLLSMGWTSSQSGLCGKLEISPARVSLRYWRSRTPSRAECNDLASAKSMPAPTETKASYSNRRQEEIYGDDLRTESSTNRWKMKIVKNTAQNEWNDKQSRLAFRFHYDR